LPTQRAAQVRQASTPAETFPDDAVEVGRIAGAWGVRGGIRVKPFAARPLALLHARQWFLRAGDAPAATRPLPAVLQVEGARAQGGAVVAVCAALPDRNAAEALRGARVFVSRAQFPRAEADEYYWVDLIGLEVRNRQDERLGVVSGLLETGPQCVLCVAPADAAAAELLIPFVAAHVDRVDLDARLIRVDWQRDDAEPARA